MQRKNNRDKFIKTVESARVPGMGPGRELHGTYLGLSVQLDGYWSKDYVGQKMFNTGRGLYLRGLADDVTLRHYGCVRHLAGASVTHFMSWPQQPSFSYASDSAGPVRNNHVTDERN